MSTAQGAMWYGHQRRAWDAAKEQATAILRQIATAGMRPIYYSELAAKIGAIAFGPHDHDFHALLGEVSLESEQQRGCLLSALVIAMDTGLLGSGFFVLAKECGREVSDVTVCWARETERVYAAYQRR